MSIPALKQVYDETRRLAIAGSVVASGDFRLKKLVPALEKGNLYQLREYIRQLNAGNEGDAEGIEEMPDDGALEGVVVH